MAGDGDVEKSSASFRASCPLLSTLVAVAGAGTRALVRWQAAGGGEQRQDNNQQLRRQLEQQQTYITDGGVASSGLEKTGLALTHGVNRNQKGEDKNTTKGGGRPTEEKG